MNLISRLWQYREGEGCEATLGKLSQPIVKEVLNFDNLAGNVTWHAESHLIEIFTVTLWTFLLSKNLNDTMQLQLKKFWHEILPKENIMHNSSSNEWEWLDKNYI